MVKDAYTPSASFELQQYKDDKYHFAFILKNHSKASLNCWCNLNPTVCGQYIKLDNFYGAKTSFDLQPFGSAMGHFDIQEILQKANKSLTDILSESKLSNAKSQLYLDIEFWYNPIGLDLKISNPKQPHFFDFDRKLLVADF